MGAAGRRRLGLIVAVLALVGGGVWWVRYRPGSGAAAELLKASGTIRADEVEVGAQRAARLARYEVAEGQSVKQGQVIAVLDTSELAAQLAQAQGTAATAAARLSELLRGTRREKVRSAAAQVAQAQANVDGATRTLANARMEHSHRTGLRQALDAAEAQEKVARATLQQAQATVASADQALKTAQEEHETSIQLRQTRDAARQQLETAQAGARASQAQLAQLLNGTRVEVIRAAEAQVGQTTASLQGAREEMTQATSDLARAEELHAGRALSDQQLDTARTRAETARARLNLAQDAKNQSEARLAELRAGARTEEIEAARATAEQGQAAAEGARLAVANAEQAYELRLGARGQLESARAQREIAGAGLAGARAALSGAVLAVRNARHAYTDALEERQGVDTGLQQYQSALAQLEAAGADLELSRNGATPEEIAQARGQLRQARGALELAQAQYEQSQIRAPMDGVLTEQVAMVGEVVTPGATVAELVALDSVYLTLYVPLAEMGKVKLGQRAEVTTDTYRGKVHRGVVTQISDSPGFTPRNVQTQDERVKLVYQVKVTVENPNRELKPGMPADATISLRSP
jgi:HlyD family secretion protein